MTKRSFIVDPAAEEDLTNAFRWYENKRLGLGSEFLRYVDQLFDQIAQSPEGYAVTYKDVRQALVKRFPYVVCYVTDPAVTRIIAVYHGHRDPDFWQSRIS